MTDPNAGAPDPSKGAPSKKGLLIGVAVAAVAAAAIVVAFVLPAEFGVDPTGIGEATGLTGLAGANGENGAVVESDALQLGADGSGVPGAVSDVTFMLEGYGAVEHKVRMAAGQTMGFSWEATAPVHIDMHAHDDVQEESYSQGDFDGQSGVYTARFDGIHGWYFQNRNLDPVSVTLHRQGGFTSTLVIDEFGEHETPVQ